MQSEKTTTKKTVTFVEGDAEFLSDMQQSPTVPDAYSIDFWREQQQQDEFCQRAAHALRHADATGAASGYPAFQLSSDNGLVWHVMEAKSLEQRLQLVVPEGHWINALLWEYHDKRLGHAGHEAVLAALRERFWFPNMSQRVGEWIKGCSRCSRANERRRPSEAGAHALAPPPTHSHTFGIDAAGPFPTVTLGRFVHAKYLIVAVDCLTGRVALQPVPDVKAVTLMNFIMDRIGFEIGFPRRLHHDRAAAFMSRVSQRFFAEYGIETVPTSGGNPDSNGSAERMIGFINRKL